MTMEYVLSVLTKVSRLDPKGRSILSAGDGDNRAHLALDGPVSEPVLRWLFGCTDPQQFAELVNSLAQLTGLSDDDATGLVTSMIEMKVLVDGGIHTTAREHLVRWGRFGWRDAADFHLATFGLRFVPDEMDGLTYAEHFSSMLGETESAGPQPAAYEPRDGLRVELSTSTDGQSRSLEEVLAAAEPINRFEGPPVRGPELLPALRAAFGIQRTVGGMLGEHQLRSYPSGGARHPFEMYLVSKGIDGVPAGAYQFDPLSGELLKVISHGNAHEIDAACFGKGGIVTADAVLVLTCRWLRHSWKYRYARSYRMLMLEAGHIVQAVALAMVRQGLHVYHCPSIDDGRTSEILALGDDCAEGPVYAIGLGHGGVR